MSRFLTLSLVVVLLSSTALGSNRRQDPPEQDAEEAQRLEREKKALALLEEIVEVARRLQIPENRISAEVRAASLLWTHDERRARTLVKQTLGSIGELLQAASSPEAFVEDSSRFGQLYQMRSTLLDTVAQRDPALALELLRGTRLPSNAALEGYASQDLNLEAQFLNMLATKSPKKALEAAEDALERGVSYGILNLVNSLRASDPAAASKLASAIAARLQTTNLLENYEVASVAINLVQYQLSTQGKVDAGGGDSQPLLSDSEVRQLIARLVGAALQENVGDPNSASIAQNLRNQLRVLGPAVTGYVPELAQELEAAYAKEPKQPADEQQAFWTRWNDLVSKGDIDAMVAAAASAPQSYRDNLFQQAASSALAAGDSARAQSIVSNSITNPYMRAQILADLDRQAAQVAVQENDVAKARAAVARLKSASERVGMLLQMANSLSSTNKKLARRMIDEALGEIDERPTNSTQFLLKLQVADALIPYDPSAAGSLVEPLVGQLNVLVGAAAALDGFDCQQSFRDGEMIDGSSTLSSLIQGLATSLANLATNDFDRARAAGNAAERPEIRVVLLLSVAQSALNGGQPQVPVQAVEGE
jgi:hypothetical protein